VSQLLPNTQNNKLSWSFIQTVVSRLCILIIFPTECHYVENSLHLVQSIINPQCVFDRVHVLRCCFDVCFRTNLLLHLVLFFLAGKSAFTILWWTKHPYLLACSPSTLCL